VVFQHQRHQGQKRGAFQQRAADDDLRLKAEANWLACCRRSSASGCSCPAGPACSAKLPHLSGCNDRRHNQAGNPGADSEHDGNEGQQTQGRLQVDPLRDNDEHPEQQHASANEATMMRVMNTT
jgi:hypothetical protein